MTYYQLHHCYLCCWILVCVCQLVLWARTETSQLSSRQTARLLWVCHQTLSTLCGGNSYPTAIG